MINLLITGANGRMGKKVFESALNSDKLKAVCGVDLIENLSNPDFPVYSSFDCVKEKIDVVVILVDLKNYNDLVKEVIDDCLDYVDNC